MPIVLNAANEVAVQAFLDGRLGFMGIPRLIAATMNAHEADRVSAVAQVRRVDAWARQRAGQLAGELEFTC